MPYETLVVEIKNGVGLLWLNRPEAHNAFEERMIGELTAALRMLEEEPAVRAVVLAATGKVFCAGPDRAWLERLTENPFERNLAGATALATMLHALHTLPKPTVARVHGPAHSGGVGLVAACDMAVAAYDAEFCLSEVRCGLIPATITPYLIRAMGERAARHYALTGVPFPAAEAYRTGLLTDIVPPEELDGRINELLGQLVQGAPSAQALCKEWFRQAAAGPITPALIRDGATRTATVLAGEEVRTGLAALQARRRSPWLPKIARPRPEKADGTPKTRRRKGAR